MPKKRKRDSLTATRELIVETCRSFRKQPKPPEVVDRFTTKYWKDFFPRGGKGGNEIALKAIFIVGLRHLVQQIMHQGYDLPPPANDDEQQLSLELWPVDERTIAAEIGIDAAYVPSRGTYVALYDRSKISNDELDEAVKHLLAHADAVRHRATWITRLRAKRMEDAKAA